MSAEWLGGGWTSTKTAALVFGIVFAVVGFLGSCGAAAPGTRSTRRWPSSRAMALGMFPVNTAHNVVHLLFAVLGIAALAAAGRAATSRAAAYGLLTRSALIS